MEIEDDSKMSAHKCGFSVLIGLWDTPVLLIFVLTLTFLQHVTLTEPKDTGHRPSLTKGLPMCQCSLTYITSPQTTHNITQSAQALYCSFAFPRTDTGHLTRSTPPPPPPITIQTLTFPEPVTEPTKHTGHRSL